MKRLSSTAICAVLVAVAVPGSANAQADKAERPALLKALTGCRNIQDVTARLECFDRAAAAIDEAEARRDLVVVDRGQIRSTRKSLFGLVLPNLSIFGDDNVDEEGVSRIESTIKGVSQTTYGKWVFTLPDGAQWEQIDTRNLPVTPRAGQEIKIRKAAMGSYLANVHNQVAIRVKRSR